MHIRMDLRDMPDSKVNNVLSDKSRVDEIIKHLTNVGHKDEKCLGEHRKELYLLSLLAGEERQKGAADITAQTNNWRDNRPDPMPAADLRSYQDRWH